MKNRTKKTSARAAALLLTLVLVLSPTAVLPAGAQTSPLRFGGDGTFTVLQITDPQDDHHPARDMLNLIELSIEKAKPDLVIFTGDIVEDERVGDIGIDDESGREGVYVTKNGELDLPQTLANTRAAATAIFDIVNNAGIPFAVTQGNNDYSSGIGNENWLDIYDDFENCLVTDESDDEEGRIDYNLEILASGDDSTAFNFWLMDTKRGDVTAEQIAWYEAESAALKQANGGTPVPAMVFQHIQTKDIWNLFEPCKMWDDGAVANGTEFYRLNKDIANGYYTSTGPIGEESDEFAAWKRQGDVIAAFFGHYHTEGYSGVWNSIELGFTYGCEMAKPGPYGVRVIALHENDIKNYDNDLYRYKGKVDLGTASLDLQIDEPYPVYDNPFTQMFAYLGNFIYSIYSIIRNLFV